MSFEIIAIDEFQKELKKLLKKYPSLKEEIFQLGNSLMENPKQGKPIGKDCYKIRLQIKSKGKGKSSGGRIITHVFFSGQTVFLLTIYDKSEKENISEVRINELLKKLKI
ncbi:hypothetical protein [Algoriphagus boritolerans]|uniref:mRNA-degrading endonuclease RelE, toxin component of the RelBE toxin-antitoxin system n=1 Tax=Algoriphagus boritolerans DSM 17298 = JCM 18970 TaxID=1120964 RepID=A0A1H5V9G2_9BACT|nr:hypothetical protein [Algoriphagus boritolerans]SEF83834.1 hypothetical protein SAMN03080598_01597 [Algoriphagus boritolerans DSM 17298 = JCM 18970]